MQNNYFLGPYNRGYLAALRFFRGSRETRQPRYKIKKITKITQNYITTKIFVSRLSWTPVTQSFSLTGVQDSRDTKIFVVIFISRLSCFAAAENTIWSMVPQQVKFRLPRRPIYQRLYDPLFFVVSVSEGIFEFCAPEDIEVGDELRKIINFCVCSICLTNLLLERATQK